LQFMAPVAWCGLRIELWRNVLSRDAD